MTTEKKRSTRLENESHSPFVRCTKNPLITPELLKDDSNSKGTFNPAFYNFSDARYLVIRSDETSGVNHESSLPYRSKLRYGSFVNDCELGIFRDLAIPDTKYNEFGCEDPNAVVIADTLHLTYNGISRYGSTIYMADFDNNHRLLSHEMILGIDHKHAALFPKKENDLYHLISRPLPRLGIESFGPWLYQSTDLFHWKPVESIFSPRAGYWDCKRVGIGSTPIWLEDGWLVFYYGVDVEESYHVGAVLLDHDSLCAVIGRSESPLLSPDILWERTGRRSDTVFPGGAEYLNDSGEIRLYYGAADTHVGVATLEVSKVLELVR